MYSSAEPRSRVCLLLALLAAVGCYDEHPCKREVCDGRDNDCDGKNDEDFVDEQGLYLSDDACGGCAIRCDDVFPTAERTRCVVREARAICEIVACPEGWQLAGAGACVPITPVECLPCAEDGECELHAEGARCVADTTGAKHCAPSCAASGECATGFSCRDALCVPASGACICDAELEGAELACELSDPDGAACAGLQLCSGGELGECRPALEESCNEADDDCDGKIDEGFRDESGRYTSAEHCGACGAACTALGPHMLASCEAGADKVECRSECAPGFVDRDGIAADGCECELVSSSRPLVGADADCDGEPDPAPELVFVSQAGDDAQAGTSPDTSLRSLARGLALAAMLGRDVLVARGVYQGPLTLPAGVSITGGYSPDFTEQDPTLYPVLIEGGAALSGEPLLRCQGTNAEAHVQDLTFEASAPDTPSQGSTAISLDGCSSELVFEHVTILAARAAPGRAGEDSSAGLDTVGGIAALTGSAGSVGAPGGYDAMGCPPVPGGAAGSKRCLSGDVSGGRGGAAECAVLNCDNVNGPPCGNAGCTDFTSNGVCNIAGALAVATANPAPERGRGLSAAEAGIPTYNAPSNHGACSFCDDNPSLPRFGDDGADGESGADGAGGASCSGQLSIDTRGRVAAANGGNGIPGGDGAGGGGGSAGSGFARIRNTRGTCESLPGGAGGGGGS
ncbi:MAG TPA: hypothetical protein VJV78_29835, partial [Polyangiales bacterium]|nr:hypothetical protein [Polyangiales bacterium]